MHCCILLGFPEVEIHYAAPPGVIMSYTKGVKHAAWGLDAARKLTNPAREEI